MNQDWNLDVIQARSKVLAAEDRSMRKSLVNLRRGAGLTQQDVAEFMGCTQQAVQKLERYDADPKLSTLRRYANAVGALVRHSVVSDCDGELVRNHGRSSEKTTYAVYGWDGNGLQVQGVEFHGVGVECLLVEPSRESTWGKFDPKVVIQRVKQDA